MYFYLYLMSVSSLTPPLLLRQDGDAPVNLGNTLPRGHKLLVSANIYTEAINKIFKYGSTPKKCPMSHSHLGPYHNLQDN